MKTNQPNLRQSFKGMVTIELKNHVSIQQNIKLIFVVAQILHSDFQNEFTIVVSLTQYI